MAGKPAENNSRQPNKEPPHLGDSPVPVLSCDSIECESLEQLVSPWEVSAKDGGKIDYKKLIDKFGCLRINESLIDRVESLSGREPHAFLRRGVFFAHRDLDVILDAYSRGEKFYLYTGRGPSSEALHLGHLIPFMFSKYLQQAFNVPLVIQLTDDEKFTWKKDLSVEETKRLARENAKDIIACGFDVTKTFVFSDFDYLGGAFYENMVKIGESLTYNKAMEMFGFSGEDYIAKLNFPLVQAAPSFASSFPQLFPGKDNLRCLIPCAIDQDSCFIMARDSAPPLGYRKPALIESSFFPALHGMDEKVSATDPNSAIYLTDTAEAIAKKVNLAISGGQDKTEDQEKHGANLEKDIPFKYLSFFLEDDIELEHIKKEYGEGRMLPGQEKKMLSGPVKERVVQVLTQVVERHCRTRADVTEELVDAFMAVRPLPAMYGSRKSESCEQLASPPREVSAKGSGKMDDNKRIDIDESLIDRVKRLTGREPHVFLRRGVFSSHLDFNEILDAYEGGEMFYLFTGRGPSSGALHLGDLIPLMFTKYLQEAFGVPVVVQLRDDGVRARDSAKDVIACGLDVTNTFIFSNDYIGGAFYKNMVKTGECVTVNKARGIFGFSDEDCLSKYCFPPVQASPSFPSSFPHLFSGMDKLPCLIPCAIDQDPYFRMTRDVAPRLGFSKPSLIESTFFPGLQGFNGKMSASDPNSAIYVTDTAEDIAYKINKCTTEEYRDLEENIPFQYLSFFLEDDDELERIRKDYGEGKMLPGALKKRLIDVLTKVVEMHRTFRAAVTDEMVDAFMAVRPLPTIFE